VTQNEPAIQAVVRWLANSLGPDLMGEMCGLPGPAPLKKWQISEPGPDLEGRLRLGYEALRTLRQTEGLEAARLWLTSPNPGLGDKDPVVAIGEGHGASVLAAAVAHVRGLDSP
jgi:hypothetical protein